MNVQTNPVDWHPWGPEAIQEARSQNKMIFLSIGYRFGQIPTCIITFVHVCSTCHWCHVMERESFECHETAALMNQHFVNIKVDRCTVQYTGVQYSVQVDREERPDVDKAGEYPAAE